MKTIVLNIVFLLFLGQLGYGQLNTLGLDRSIGGSGMFAKGSKNKENKKPADLVKLSADNMERELKLDAFQKAAATTYIEQYKNDLDGIYLLDIPDDGKMEKMNVAKDKMETGILSLLRPDQVVLFNDLKDKKGKKGKRK